MCSDSESASKTRTEAANTNEMLIFPQMVKPTPSLYSSSFVACEHLGLFSQTTEQCGPLNSFWLFLSCLHQHWEERRFKPYIFTNVIVHKIYISTSPSTHTLLMP